MLKNLKDGLGFTAVVLTCFKLNGRKIEFWKKLGLSPSRSEDLFDSKYMEFFKNSFGESISNNELFWGQIWAALRHKYIDDLMLSKVKEHQVEQIIILGAGFDTRSETYKLDNVQYFEVDVKQVLDIKKEVYSDHAIIPQAVHISSNYLEDNLINTLKEHGVSLQKETLFIWEGNSMYISRENTNQTWNLVFNNFEKYSIVMDFLSQAFIEGKTEKKEHQDLLDSFNRLNARFINGYDNIEDFCRNNKLKLVENYSMDKLSQKYGVHNEGLPVLEEYSMCYVRKNQDT